MAFRAHARDIGSAFQNREDLRLPICAALIRMCTQNRRILQVPPGTMLTLAPLVSQYRGKGPHWLWLGSIQDRG